MPGINLNLQLADLLKGHGITVDIADEFINTDLPGKVRFKANAVYNEIKSQINSRLDIMAITGRGERIIESCGDVGETIEEAISHNFQNFSYSTLHPLLAALGCVDTLVYDQITLEEWEINDRFWNAYIGNLVPKFVADGQTMVYPPAQFFDAIERAIKSQHLTKRLHWFRGYYCQLENEITSKEFLMDNELLSNTDKIFESLPIIPKVQFYSCRNFIILKDKAYD